ncbi:MAG: hypothetical protein JWN48_4198 [Myxococcaceae bacterium]|nr:hypothetical protein [Myxococcaceae bacterium]
MTRRLIWLAALSVSAAALPAELGSRARGRASTDEPECQAAAYEWELELTRVECESGDADLQAVATSLGTQAILRGGYRDPNHPKTAPRAVLVGSTDGAGLNVGLEKSQE